MKRASAGRGDLSRRLLAGAMAGAAGTTALNTLSYLDMIVRARPASSLPEKAAGRLAERLHADLGEGEHARNREQGLGPMLGIATGLGVGIAYALVRGAMREVPLPAAAGGVGVAASVASNAPMTTLRLTDPRKWGLSGWLSDIIPHLGYGLVTAAVVEAMTGRDSIRRGRR
ncbi:hypothetical protein HNP84_001046 [Thermocatellispora tengchongensis]|uniref:DUF1440 domain-containing protein n=1 Tax=Thermocatellispora tengchongensis TaxID=1073253 RepID=A0A840P1J6_9ACTN|nr:hypothetical protein [Thermocatellispora tengchongensis]MBB5131340.1 hypothetical protein [Thermocatellispora tengchongensis]